MRGNHGHYRISTIFNLITALCAYIFQNYWENLWHNMYLPTKNTLSKKDQQRTYLMRFMHFCFWLSLQKHMLWVLIELHRQVDAIQIGTHNISLCKEEDKKYIGSNLKTTELLDCALIGACAVIRSNTIFVCIYLSSKQAKLLPG